jgi:hypothetical protein
MSSIWDFPSPPLPMKGRVWSGVFSSIGPHMSGGTSPFMGEDGRGK